MLGGGCCNHAAPPGLGLNPLAHWYKDVVVSSGMKMGTMWLSRVLVLLLYDERERDKRDNDPTMNATARTTTTRT